MKKTFLFFVFIFLSLIIYARYFEHGKIKTHEYTIKSAKLDTSFDGFKIVHFSDFLFPNTTDIDTLKTLVKKINKENPDLVIFTGNLIDKTHSVSDKNKNLFIHWLSKINSNIGKYAIYGDHDFINDKVYRNIMEESNFTILFEEGKNIYYKSNKPILLKNYSSEQTINTNDDSLFSIALIHKPDSYNNVKDYNDLYLAGHSLGGYINPIIINPLILKEGAKVFINGKYTLRDNKIIISNGIGTDNINFRFNNFPSFNIYTLKKTTK